MVSKKYQIDKIQFIKFVDEFKGLNQVKGTKEEIRTYLKGFGFNIHRRSTFKVGIIKGNKTDKYYINIYHKPKFKELTSNTKFTVSLNINYSNKDRFLEECQDNPVEMVSIKDQVVEYHTILEMETKVQRLIDKKSIFLINNLKDFTYSGKLRNLIQEQTEYFLPEGLNFSIKEDYDLNENKTFHTLIVDVNYKVEDYDFNLVKYRVDPFAGISKSDYQSIDRILYNRYQKFKQELAKLLDDYKRNLSSPKNKLERIGFRIEEFDVKGNQLNIDFANQSDLVRFLRKINDLKR